MTNEIEATFQVCSAKTHETQNHLILISVSTLKLCFIIVTTDQNRQIGVKANKKFGFEENQRYFRDCWLTIE